MCKIIPSLLVIWLGHVSGLLRHTEIVPVYKLFENSISFGDVAVVPVCSSRQEGLFGYCCCCGWPWYHPGCKARVTSGLGLERRLPCEVIWQWDYNRDLMTVLGGEIAFGGFQW